MPEPKRNGDKTDLEWESFREVIHTLYVVQDHSLEHVRNEMKETYNFAATYGSVYKRYVLAATRANSSKQGAIRTSFREVGLPKELNKRRMGCGHTIKFVNGKESIRTVKSI